MNDISNVADFQERVNKIEEALSVAACGDFSVRLEILEENQDFLTPIELGVNMLISDMGDEVHKSRLKAQELQEKLDLIEKQRRAIEELSTPIIKIWEKVLVLPLIGVLDTRRSQKLTEQLLQTIAEVQAKLTIIDITGVPTVDSAVANHLIKTVNSVKLLGAECVITGIRPEVAQTIIYLGLDLSDIQTLANLSEGLKLAFERLNMKIVNLKPSDSI